MKKRIFLPLFVIMTFLMQNFGFAQTGTWTALTNQAPDPAAGCMLLLTDGTVLCSTPSGFGYGTVWDKLTPDIHGSYVNGTWTQIAQSNYDRTAFSSQVLPSGKVYVAGGEYGQGGYYGEVYDPVADTWTVCGNIPVNWNIYDAPSELLYTGNVLEGPEIGANGGQPCNSILQWNPVTLNYTTENPEPGNHDEAAWIKLPDSTVLAISMPYPNNPAQDSTCRFQPATNTWIQDGLTPNNLFDQWGFEAGGAILLPNGKVIAFGATQYNALYTPSGNSKTPGTWTAAANYPKISGQYVTQPDAASAMMVNGHILLAVSPIPTSNFNLFNTPTYFIEYNYVSNTFTQVTANIPTIGANNLANCISQNQGLLDLPDGNVLMCSNAISNPNQYFVYTPGSGPIAQGKPTITGVTTTNCTTFQITGKLFNGISEGTGYGDDVQNSTNYPLVRLTNGSNVYYAKTTNWNRVGAVMTDSLPDTAYFTLPAGIPNGTYSLVVVANGFASSPTTFVLPCVPAGTEQLNANDNTVKVYPNPSKGIYTFEATLPMTDVTLEIDNVMGQQVMKEQTNLAKKEIDLSEQPEGIYFYRLISSSGNLLGQGKLVLEK